MNDHTPTQADAPPSSDMEGERERAPLAPGDEAPPQEPAVGEVECPECHGSGRLNGEA